MDDPLVGLTIWQSVQQKKAPNKAKAEDILSCNDSVNAKGVLMNGGGKREKADKARGPKRKEGKRGGKGKREALGTGEDDEDNCFPCLPGLEDVAAEKTGGKRRKES